MKNQLTYLIIIFSLLQFSCKDKEKKYASYGFKLPEIVEAKGYIVPGYKTSPPEIVPLKEIKNKSVKKPTVFKLNSNVHTVAKPKIIPVSAPQICIPGEGNYNLPEIVPAIDSPFAAGAPEITLAKEPQINNNNPSCFSTFKVLHGLKTNDIYPIIQDKAGNLWIACFEGGVCKYDGRSFTNYTTVQGLSNDDVWSMLEDSKGNLWFGTLGGGLNKFDGKSFTHYTTKQGLSSNDVLSILEDKKGNLWFGTGDGGINKYDGKTFIHYTIKQGLPGNHVRSIIEDSKGALWLGTRGGISKFDGKSFSNYTAEQGLNNTDVMCILQDHEGTIWFSTYGGGFNKFDGKVIENYSVDQGLPDSLVYNIAEDRSGNIWFSMYNEYVIKYDGKSFIRFGTEQGLSNSKVHSILEDKAGNTWFGTNSGLCKYNGKVFTHFNSDSGFSQKVITNLYEDEANNIWIGIYGDGIKKFNEKSVTHYTTEQGLTDNNVLCVTKDSNALWICTHFGGLNKYEGNSFSHFENFPPNTGIWALLKDSKGNIWIGTSKGLYKYDGKNFTHFGTAQGLSGESILSICEDKNGNLWLGTELDGVVNKLDLSGEETGRYSFTHYDIRQGSSLFFVYSIIEDKTGNLWFGTSNSGVIKFDGKFFSYYTTAQGLSNNSINSIVEDKKGNIWFLTENGLCKLPSQESNAAEKIDPSHKKTALFKTYLFADGFFGVGSHYNSMILANDGNIWAGASNWLTRYHPEGDVPDTIPPTIQLRGVALFDENIKWIDAEKKKDSAVILSSGTKLNHFKFTNLSPWYNQPENLQLAYDNNYVTFQFIGITTSRPKEVRYKYFLEGIDENWSSITDKPEATYTNLPSGKFTFKVKAVNSEGYWSNELNYSFTILTPWWKTWWFNVLAVSGMLCLFYSIVRWRLHQKFRIKLERSEKEKQLAELQQQKSELEMQVLRTQMNPHFIFNSLNSINRFILQNNKAQASEYLFKFSKLVRLILQNSQSDSISLESEIESLRLYIEMEMLRFDYHFDFKIIVDKELETDMIKIPPLIIQPYTENAIWHGLMHKQERGYLKIELFREHNALCCKVIDNGIGRKKAGELKSKSASIHKSMGMQITAQRIAILQQQKQLESAIQIQDLLLPDGSAGGTEVIIKIPLQYD